MPLYVLSDLHISGPEDLVYHSLLKLMRTRITRGDVLVLAGDIFDLFVGPKKIFIDRFSEFFEEAARLSRVGIEIHYIEGNHDFLIHRVFKNSERVRVYPKSASILLGQKRFFFAHGDTVDQEDIGYRFLRGFLRSPIAKLALAVVPGVVVDQIGRTSAKKSRCRSQHLSLDRREILRKKFRSFAADRMREGHDFVVMGHCHDLDQMSFIVDGRKAQYINVGFPREHGSMLSWTPGDETIEREKLP